MAGVSTCLYCHSRPLLVGCLQKASLGGDEESLDIPAGVCHEESDMFVNIH